MPAASRKETKPRSVPPGEPRRRRTRRPRAEREAEILASARAVFSERGYGDAAVAEIAERSGVVEGTVYSYFETKRALLIAVMKSFFEELIADTESGLAAVRGTENRLRFVIRRHLETFTSDLGLCRVIIREARPDVALYDEAILDLNRRYTGIGLRVLEEGVAGGDLRPGIAPSVIRDLIYGGIEHAVWRFLFSDGELEMGLLADQLAEAVLGGILIEEESSATGFASEHAATVSRLERAVERLEAKVGL
ncbi:MAG: TetR/AcrR family transcriptional regulator [Myxococcota bacterium]